MSTIDPDPNHTPDPDPQPLTAIEQALRAAGAEITRSFSDAGLRIVATAALGQVLAGLPDAAKGMIDALKPEQQYALFEAITALQDIALDATPEAKSANHDHATTTATEAHAYTLAVIYRAALLRKNVDLHRRLDTCTPDELLLMRGAAVTLVAAIDARLSGVTDRRPDLYNLLSQPTGEAL
jgi:hypothetical protein